MKIVAAYQGAAGAQEHSILREHFAGREVELQGYSTSREVAVAVSTGHARYGLLPIDNAISGTFRDGYDLIARYNLLPVRELNRRLDQRLLGVAGASLSGLREIHGHPNALDECGAFLGTLVGAVLIPATDAGVAARTVAERNDPSVASVGPAEAAELYKLIELAPAVADSRSHFTRFLLVELVSPDQVTPPTGGPRRTSVLFRVRNETGALAKCVTLLAEAGVNMTKLESRPQTGRSWEAGFYMDLDGDLADKAVFDVLTRMRQHTTGMRTLGSYDIDASRLHDIGNITGEFEAPPTSVRMASIVTAGSISPNNAQLNGGPVGRSLSKSAVPPPGAVKSWPRAAREARPWGTTVKVDGIEVGGDEFIIIAGPCSVESREQTMRTAEFVRDHGAVMLRGGVFKPRTTPYAFQGMGWDGLAILAEASRANGLPSVSEVMSVDQVERMAREVDVLQIGARNMQNFDLLKAVGRVAKPVLLKRGLSATLDELLAAAEYILSEGNPDVILCERGIRTFENATRNTLDISAIPVLRERTHLPIIVDPSHAVGVRRWIRPLARAAKAVGAHGIIVEVHPDPPHAKSDADQALRFEQFREIVEDLRAMPNYLRPDATS